MSVECVCCDIGCLTQACGILFVLHFFNLVCTSCTVGCLEGVCVLSFQRYAIVLAACVLSLIVLSEFDYGLCLYLGLLACLDVPCCG